MRILGKLPFLAGLAAATLLLVQTESFAQVTTPGDITGQDVNRRVINPAMPFLLISPDARGASLGDMGAATSPDVFASHWNPAKLAFTDQDMSISFSHTPWLRALIGDMSLNYLTFNKRITKTQVIGASLRYFDLGDIQFRNDQGVAGQGFSPREFEISGTYSQVLSENFSFGANLKFALSNLTGSNVGSTNSGTKSATAIAIDLGTYYNKDVSIGPYGGKLSLAAVISNIGNKVSYFDSGTGDNSYFIPSNFRLGSGLTMNLDSYNKLFVGIELNKLMVPTPPEYQRDSNGAIEFSNGKPVILDGKDPNRGYLSAIFGSFADAPDGFSEELQEFTLSVGAEYWYNDLFAARLGYFYEPTSKGDRKYLTMGVGIKYQKLGFDFAYLVPQGRRNHPLANTFRLGISYSIGEAAVDAVTAE